METNELSQQDREVETLDSVRRAETTSTQQGVVLIRSFLKDIKSFLVSFSKYVVSPRLL
jgi:hypothetical protein